jgi:CrcB protein
MMRRAAHNPDRRVHADHHPAEPIDPDVDIRHEVSPLVAGLRHPEARAIGAVAAGGVVGAVCRYEAGVLWPTPSGHFPWTTLVVNVVGCALIGVLMVLTTDVFRTHWMARRALSTGLLGGFTTFSTYAVDAQRLLATHHPALALADLALTVTICLLAVVATTRMTRRIFAGRIAAHAEVLTA